MNPLQKKKVLCFFKMSDVLQNILGKIFTHYPCCKSPESFQITGWPQKSQNTKQIYVYARPVKWTKHKSKNHYYGFIDIDDIQLINNPKHKSIRRKFNLILDDKGWVMIERHGKKYFQQINYYKKICW